MSRARRMLSAAADLIEEHGWVRGKYGNITVGFCPLAAIGYVLHSDDRYDSLDADTAIRMLDDSLGLRIADWNDNLASGAEEVVSEIRKAARV